MSACHLLLKPPRAAPALLALCMLGGCAAASRDAGPAAALPAELAGLPAGATLIGLRGGDLEGFIGQPALVRQEGAAQYWRYGLADCQLDLFLYADPKTGAARVTYLDARPTRGVPASPDRCRALAGRLRAGTPPPEPLPGPPVSAPL